MKKLCFLPIVSMLCVGMLYSDLSAQTLDTKLPQTNNGVSVVTYDPASNTIYIGGSLTGVGTQTGYYHNAALDASTGNVKDWNPNVSTSVNAIAVYGSNIFICGSGAIAKVDGSGSIIWTKAVSGASSIAEALAVSASGSTVFVGGLFMQIGGVPTNGSIAALNTSDGGIIWSEATNEVVRSLAVSGDTLYLGGNFTSVNYTSRNHLAALNASDGSLLSWNPGANGEVMALSIEGSTLFVGGRFTLIGTTTTRNRLAAFDIPSGNLLDWNPNANYDVMALAVDASTVYVGGVFNVGYGTPTLGGSIRNYIAAVDASSGNATAWNPCAGNVVEAIALSYTNKEVYVGGIFTTIDATSTNYFAGLDDTWDTALPIQATDFLAKADVGSVTLSWETQSEVNNAGFNILRTLNSELGTPNWELVGSYRTDKGLAGLGTSTTGRAYQFVDSKVKSGATYNYKIQSVNAQSMTTSDLMTLSVTVDVPKAYALYQNYPNPFNPSTTIRFDLKQQSTVTLEIYNVLGQRVEYWNYGMMDAGQYNKVVAMASLSSGVYYYRIMAQGNDGQRFVSVKKLVLMK